MLLLLRETLSAEYLQTELEPPQWHKNGNVIRSYAGADDIYMTHSNLIIV